MNWSLDRHLQRKMALTLLALVVQALVIGAGIAVLAAWGLTWLGVSFLVALPVGVVLTLVGGGVVLHTTLGKDAAETFDAEEVGPADEPALHDAVTRMAQAADLPIPTVYVADEERPFAMTTGLSTSDAKLVVSTALLDALDERELDAVVAHELAHVKNRDAAVMTLVELPLSSAKGISAALRSSGGIHPALLGIAVGTYALWWSGRTLVASLSRSRELAADRGAVALLGDPAPLASALDTLAHDVSTAPETDARDDALAALSIVPTPRGEPGPALTYEKRRPLLWSLRLPCRRVRRRLNERYVHPALATHPETDDRLDRLGDLARERVRQ